MSTLDLERLLREIDPDAPCGVDLEYDVAFIALADDIKGTPEQQIGSRIEPAQPPNWKDVRKQTLELLNRTHDLRLFLYLTQACIHTDGFPGFRDCLALVEGGVSRFWTTIHPQLDPEDDNDPTQRVNILMGLCDFDLMLRPLTLAPLVVSRALGRYAFRDVQIATGKLPASSEEGSSPPDSAAIRAAFLDADPESLDATRQALTESMDALTAIESFVTDQVGVGNAPNFAATRALLKEIQSAFLEYRGETPGIEENPAEEDEPSGASSGMVTVKTSAATVSGAVNNRQDVVKALDLICEYYSKHEPSSPIPLLLKRARRLVSKNFMEIIRDLAPEGIPQIEMIKGLDPEDSGDSN